jgi:hypothetical protein
MFSLTTILIALFAGFALGCLFWEGIITFLDIQRLDRVVTWINVRTTDVTVPPDDMLTKICLWCGTPTKETFPGVGSCCSTDCQEAIDDAQRVAAAEYARRY